MIDGCTTVAEMAAIGMGLERLTFSSLMKRGPHKLAPTGSDLTRYEVGTIYGGLHYDFNFLTIHGKSKYPGLLHGLEVDKSLQSPFPRANCFFEQENSLSLLLEAILNVAITKSPIRRKSNKRRTKQSRRAEFHESFFSFILTHPG